MLYFYSSWRENFCAFHARKKDPKSQTQRPQGRSTGLQTQEIAHAQREGKTLTRTAVTDLSTWSVENTCFGRNSSRTLRYKTAKQSYFLPRLYECARSLNERTGESVNTESGRACEARAIRAQVSRLLMLLAARASASELAERTTVFAGLLWYPLTPRPAGGSGI